MITLNFKWFVGLSLAAHAAVLVSLPEPPQAPGHSSSLAIDLQPRAGQATVAAAAAPTPAPAEQPVQPVTHPAPVPELPVAPGPQLHVAESQPAVPERATSTPPVAIASLAEPVPVPARSPQPAVDTRQRLRDSIMQILTEELTYPAIARRKGWQGTVRLELHIEADGTVSHLELDQTSGYPVLDRAALDCLQTARIPDAERWLQGESTDIVIPVEYRLVDG